MGLALGDINTIRKEEGLTWYKFWPILIENYSNIPYASDTMVACSHLTQQDDESISQYLIRAKVLLACINHTSKLSQISGKGLKNLSLICGLRDSHIRRRVTKEYESWDTIQDIFESIKWITKTDECVWAYHEPMYNSVSKVSTEEIHK